MNWASYLLRYMANFHLNLIWPRKCPTWTRPLWTSSVSSAWLNSVWPLLLDKYPPINRQNLVRLILCIVTRGYITLQAEIHGDIQSRTTCTHKNYLTLLASIIYRNIRQEFKNEDSWAWGMKAFKLRSRAGSHHLLQHFQSGSSFPAFHRCN